MFVLQLSLPLSSPSHSILKKLHSALIQLLPSRRNEKISMSCKSIRRTLHQSQLVLRCLRICFSAVGSEMSESPAGSPVPTTPPTSPSKSTPPPSSPKKAAAAAKNAAKKDEAKKSKEVEKIKKWRAVQKGKIIKVRHRSCFSLVPRSRARLV